MSTDADDARDRLADVVIEAIEIKAPRVYFETAHADALIAGYDALGERIKTLEGVEVIYRDAYHSALRQRNKAEADLAALQAALTPAELSRVLAAGSDAGGGS